MPHFLCLVTVYSILVSLFSAYIAQACPWRFFGCIRTPRRTGLGQPTVTYCKVIYKRQCDCVGRRERSSYCMNRMQMVIKRVETVNHHKCDAICNTRPTWCPWQPWREHDHQCGTEIRRREKCCRADVVGRSLSDRCDLDVEPRQRVQVRNRPCDRNHSLLGDGSTSAVYFHIIVTAGGCCLLALLLITIYLKRHQLCSRPRPEPNPTEMRGFNAPVQGQQQFPLHPCVQARDPPRYEEISRSYTPPPPYDVVMAAMLQGKRQDSRGGIEI